MYKVEIPSDTLRDAAIRRRRQLDEERKQRIFDPKIRVLGIDVKSLDDQIRIKNEVKRAEKERDASFDRAMRQTNAILQHLDAEAATKCRDQLKALNEYRTSHQQPWQRREYDLYNPKALKAEQVVDDDSKIGASSCQKFEGEDLASTERKRLQQEQMKTWAKQSIWEGRMRRLKESEEQRRYEEYQRDVDEKVLALQKATQDARAAQAKADKELNLKLAEFKRLREAEQRRFEEQQNVKELNSQINGDFLTERPDVFNIGGGHQVRVDVFKGITREQSAYIMQVQEQQRAEAQAQREQKRREEERLASQEAANTRAAMLLEREKARKTREEAIQMRLANKAKSEEDKLRKHYLDKVVYTNKPTDDYFAQFNTTSR
ncbi:hypothetical protein, variant [Spizellomyces punctatus DAOM BR117]|nr:hypothetical protein, variant [Spizellomyces punctatus DAOM BR117]KNC97439.1 hypothetical protein, variant [Spizellomyces punctatus DAOM BR117]|eukprot:XP_016605479.1 hypothetical protein, variant [Spizellomyces punctatus DAOM BR117]